MRQKKWLALLLVLLLALGLSGCIGDTYENAGAIDGYTISSGLYLMAQYTAYSEAQSKVENTEKDVFSQKVEGQSASSWIGSRTEELLRRYVAVRRLCREKNITMDTAGQENIEQTMQYWTYLESIYKGNGIAQGSFQRFLSVDELSRQLFTALFGEGGQLAVPDGELKAEYSEKYAHVRMISFPLSSTAEGVEVREEVIALAESMVGKLEGGQSLEDIAEKEAPAVYELLLRDYDVSTAADNLFDTWVEYGQEPGETYSREELDLLKAQPVGAFGFIVASSTVMVYEKIPMFEDDAAFQDRRETILTALKTEVYEEYLRSVYSAYTAEWIFGARWYMRPQKIL